MTMKNRWNWEATDPSRSGSSGDISKLFRHEQTKSPGVLELDAPPPTATLMAREVIQNSWDAARELQEEDSNAPTFEIRFEFETFAESAKKAFVDRLDLSSLASRADMVDRYKIGLKETDSLTSLNDNSDLSILVISESGTTGMYGPWTGADSKMFLALVSLGYTEKGGSSSGGSYGYGKAGLIRGSAIRTIVAYTCFRERADDPGVTRRLLGMTYWGQHTGDGTNYTGFARFGSRSDEAVEPFKNEEADDVAESLRLIARTSSNPDDLGTTLVVVEPTVSPEDLLQAINRSWWPALEDGLFGAVVRTPDHQIHHPRPMRDEVLRSFVNAYRVATTPQDNTKTHERRFKFSGIAVGSQEFGSLGSLGLVADNQPQGWSYADQTASAVDDDVVEHRSLVALIRRPRMVVEYLNAGRTAPFVRGVFVASDEVDELLRLTEPKGHDSWQTKSYDGDLDHRATEVADAITRRTKQNVATFRNSIKPPVPPPEDVHLPYFDRFIRNVLAGKGSGWNPPVADNRPFSIRLSQRPEPAANAQIKLAGTARYSFSEHFEGEASDVVISLQYRFLEEDRVGQFIQLRVRPPSGFMEEEGKPSSFVGHLRRGEEALFEFESEPYAPEWSGRLFANGELLEMSDVEE